MAIIELKSISKAFGKNQALKNVSFRVNDKEFFCIVGPTNAGKTTTLRTIAGLEKQDEGDVLFNGENVNNLYPRERNVAMLFQNLALYPNKNGFENLATPLKIKKFPEEQIKKRVMEVAEILHITHLLERLPKTYSGGERQRVALARTIIRRPSVYLFDEPLSNLDALLRVEMRSELKRLQRDLGQTMIYVTHDQVEAISMSDRIAVLNKGKIQQIGKPSLIFSKPENMFTAGFFGSPPMNFLKCDVEKKGSKIFLVCGKLIVEVTELGEKLEGMSESKQSTPELAIRFVLSNPGVSVALSGMNTMDMLEENAAAASHSEPLNEEEKQRIQDVMDETKRLEGLYCTGCNYCMPCPVGVDIPANFSAMNMLRVWGLEGRAKRRYRQLGARYEEGKPAPAWAEACVECGECEPECPQDIPIIEKLKEVAEALSD